MKDTLIIKFLKPFQYKGKILKIGSKLDLLKIAENPITANLAAQNLRREGIAEIL